MNSAYNGFIQLIYQPDHSVTNDFQLFAHYSLENYNLLNFKTCNINYLFPTFSDADGAAIILVVEGHAITVSANVIAIVVVDKVRKSRKALLLFASLILVY
jgi:hypothetical protein